MVSVTVQGRVPLGALQDAVVLGWDAIQARISPHGALEVVGQQAPQAPRGVWGLVDQEVLGAAVLGEQQAPDCHGVDNLHAMLGTSAHDELVQSHDAYPLIMEKHLCWHDNSYLGPGWPAT